jgi:serine/threonine protein kinase
MNQFRGGQAGGYLAEGQLIADYEIMSVAGFGGMGVVYKARQRSLGRLVALKVIREEIACTGEYRERFLREARLAASVAHPHVVSIYDVGERDDQLFLAMQWIDGDDLMRVLEQTGRLAPKRAVEITCQIARALDAAHTIAGLVHRDIKPANVLLGRVGADDHAYLTDFGVAKPADSSDNLTQTGWVVGTSGYLSPEQIRGGEPGPRSDLYALGCLFFQVLTGRAPFIAENDMALRWAHANDTRPSVSLVLPALGHRYDSFVATALAVDPDRRFASGRDFAAALAASPTDDGAPTAKVAVMRTPTAVGPPTPIPPQIGGAQAATPIYPAYGYATPPASPPPGRSGNPLALILLGIVALAGIAVGALAASGVLSHTAVTRTSASSAVSPAVKPKASRHHSSPSSHKKVPAAASEARSATQSTETSTTRTQVRALVAHRVHVDRTPRSTATNATASDGSVPAVASNTTSTVFSEMSPPSDSYSILLPSDWTYQSGGGSTDLWIGPVPNERLQVVTSSCAACVSDGTRPNPSGAGVPQGTFSSTKLNSEALAYEANTEGNPFPDNGVDVVTTDGYTVTGYAEADLWLPSSEHAEATKILDSFSLLKATN